MTTIYISEKTKKKLKEFIERSRVSPDFGAKKKYPNYNRAIEFLVDLGLALPLNYLEGLLNMYDDMESGTISASSEEELDKIDENLAEHVKEEIEDA